MRSNFITNLAYCPRLGFSVGAEHFIHNEGPTCHSLLADTAQNTDKGKQHKAHEVGGNLHDTRSLRMSTGFIGGNFSLGLPWVGGDVVDISSPKACSSPYVGSGRSVFNRVPLSGGEMLYPSHTCDLEANDYVAR